MHDNKIYWRLRRGVLELDFIFQEFWKYHYKNLPDDQKQYFVKLLDVQDPELLQYLVYRTKTPEEYELKVIVDVILITIDNKS